MKKKKNALAKKSSVNALGGIDFQEYSGGAKSLKIFDVKDNIRGVQGRIPQIDIIHPAQLFSDPSGKKVSKITGIILHHSAVNAFWIKPYDSTGGGQIPDCSSLDAMTPVGGENIQAKNCSVCKKNQFGSGKEGIGKACQNKWRLHLMIPGQLLPKRITLPPSNLGAIQDFLVSLLDKKIPHAAVLVELTLKEAFSKKNVMYSEIVFTPLKVITDEIKLSEIKRIKEKFAQAFGDTIDSDEFKN